MNEKFGLNIKGLTQPELKEVLETIRKIEQRHPKELTMIWVDGLETKTVKETLAFMQDVFPEEQAKKRTCECPCGCKREPDGLEDLCHACLETHEDLRKEMK